MKEFFAFVRKELYHIVRDPRSMLILLGMPIVEIILFGFAISTEVRNVRVAVFDPYPTEMTRRITRRLDANENLNISHYLHDPTLIDRYLRANKTDLVLVYGDHFEREFHLPDGAQAQLIADATDPNTSETFTSYVEQILRTVQAEEGGAATLEGALPVVKLLYNPGMKSGYYFVPGVMGMILMLICAMMTSISIVREKERGSMEVLLASPVKPVLVVVAKAIPYFLLSCVNLISILLLARYLLDVPIAGNLLLLLNVSVLFILVSLVLGLLISIFSKNQVAAMLISGMVLMMPVMVFSGLIFPIENMPRVLQWFSHLIPAKWYIRAIRKIMIEGLGFMYVWREIAVMGGMLLVLLLVSIRNFKNRLE